MIPPLRVKLYIINHEETLFSRSNWAPLNKNGNLRLTRLVIIGPKLYVLYKLQKRY